MIVATHESESNDDPHSSSVAGSGEQCHPGDLTDFLLGADSFTDFVVFVLFGIIVVSG